MNHTKGNGMASHEIESDVDRMIDSHDNEFVLSKPKSLKFCHTVPSQIF